MRERVPRLLFWAPRILCLAFALFLMVFALDVFRPGVPARAVAVALAMHSLPTVLLLLLLAVCWRRALVGAVVFGGLGLLYLAAAWGRFHWSAYAVISGSLFVVGGLFLAGWLVERHPSAPHAEAPPR